LNGEEYTGPDKIRVGNDQGLEILHSGRDILPTPSHTLHLFSLFHVPAIQKNLISVNQFTRDNPGFIEFHPNFCCVKDLQTCCCSFKARVVSACIHGPPFMLLLSLLLPTLVKKYHWINGISGWVIQLLQLLVKSSSQINCPWFLPSYPQFVHHVSRARVIVFISVSVLLFLIILCNCFSLMYGARLQ